ncbi:unnamed protein product [Cylicocyclus nassatus]|uniref:Uncharacterized protein n=1 Tax=Cylicocyclus nassatus TaxID=53992 RepID=A0AA36DJ03_CYLNA|nr:unnamed protein product [Cylicocyclus nassatus]
MPVLTANLKYSCDAGWNRNLEKIMKVDMKIKGAKCDPMCVYRAVEYAQKPRPVRLPDANIFEVRLAGEGALDRLVLKLADKLKEKVSDDIRL